VSFIQSGQLVGLHRRQFGRDKTAFDPWHYLDVLKKKPGALRNGAPFMAWELPEPLQQTRRLLSGWPDGDRQFVGILSAVPTYGLEAVTQSCAAALAEGTVSRDVILNFLSRSGEETAATDGPTPDHLPKLRLVPVVDCRRYDRLLSGGGHAS
jgi:hypothetical protein